MGKFFSLCLCLQALPIWSTPALAARLPLQSRASSDVVARSENATASQPGSNNSTHTSATSRSQNWPAAYSGLGTDEKHDVGLPNPSGFDADFFEPTPDNINASKPGDAYNRWIILAERNNSDWEERTSEMQFFLQRTLDWTDNVECSLTIKGCRQVPSPVQVNNVIWNKEHARQICYIIDGAAHMNLEAGVTSVWIHLPKMLTLGAVVG